MYAAVGRLSIPTERLLQHRVGQQLIDEVVLAADRRGFTSDVHFKVDGTLAEAASGTKITFGQDHRMPITNRNRLF